jgi:hypothetical protein
MVDNNACAICEAEIQGFGHNGQPVVDARVCDFCNDFEVIPARIKNMIERKDLKRDYVVEVEHVETWHKTITATSQQEAETMAQSQWQELSTHAEFEAAGWSLDDGTFDVVEIIESNEVDD